MTTKPSTSMIKDFGSGKIIATGTTEERSLEDRFADVVNVKDFGAVGDGVTSDTSAFQAAIDTGRPVFIPEGTFYVRSLQVTSSIIFGAGMGKSILKSDYNAPVFVNGGGRIYKSEFKDFSIFGDMTKSSNYGFFVDAGMRSTKITRVEFKYIGADAIHLKGDLAGGGAGCYYNVISECVFGDTVISGDYIKGSALFVKGTANHNRFTDNAVFGTAGHGLRFESITDNSYMCQNWFISGNGIEGTGKYNTSGTVAGIYLGQYVTNFVIEENYFENNRNLNDDGAAIICDSSSAGIGSATIQRNLFDGESYCIWVKQFTNLNITDNWRSGNASTRGGKFFIKIEDWNGSTGRGKITILRNTTHESCTVPFIDGSGIAGYPLSVGLAGEIGSDSTQVVPDIVVDGVTKRTLTGVTTVNKTGSEGDVLTFTKVNEFSGTLGAIATRGEAIEIASHGAELYFSVDNAGQARLAPTFWRPETDNTHTLGTQNYYWKDVYSYAVTTQSLNIKTADQQIQRSLTLNDSGELLFNGQKVLLET